MVRGVSKRNFIRTLSAIMLAAALAFLAVPNASVLAGDYAAPGYDAVSVSSGVVYDPTTRDFVFDVDNGRAQLHSSVLDGMVVSSTVTISGGGVFLYRNGSEYSGSLSPVSDPGEYVVMINTGERNYRVLSFTIVGKFTNYVNTYRMPTGMIVNELYYNGEAIDFDYSSVSMEREGTYRVITECIASGTMYTLETTIDRTPPTLEFAGQMDARGHYGSAVTISGLQKGEKIRATKDGSTIDLEQQTDGTYKLVDSGQYDIIAYDEAGNFSEYPVMIMAYLNASGAAFVALLILTVAAVIIYVIHKRRKLRIG